MPKDKDISLKQARWNPNSNLPIVAKEAAVRDWQMKNPGAKVVPWLIYREAGFYVAP